MCPRSALQLWNEKAIFQFNLYLSKQIVMNETNLKFVRELKKGKRIYTFDSIKVLVLYIGERPIQLNQMIQFSVNWQWDSRSLAHIVHAIGKNVYTVLNVKNRLKSIRISHQQLFDLQVDGWNSSSPFFLFFPFFSSTLSITTCISNIPNNLIVFHQYEEFHIKIDCK